MSLDPGDVSLVLQIIVFFMLILGVPLAKGGSPKNFIRHGYLTLVALAIHTVMVLVFMVYMVTEGLVTLTSLPSTTIALVVSHIIVGLVSIALGYVIVVGWLSQPIENFNCMKAKKLMTPTLILWAIALVIGFIIHVFGFF